MRPPTPSADLSPMNQIVTLTPPLLVPGLSPVIGDLLAIIVNLCESVPQNKRNAARRLAEGCGKLCMVFVEMDITQRWDEVFQCLTQVRDAMQKWSRKSWFNMLVHQGEFEAEFNDCNKRISDCVSVDGLKRA
ncbi:hypothetical protein F5887DRAFT_518631 [Amanita rubescens]|nr:hypothetical protein F5887DRAFT_518631 [Amanita rubescens]